MTDVAKEASRLIESENGVLVDVTDAMIVDQFTMVDIPRVQGQRAWAIEMKGRVYENEDEVRFFLSLAHRDNVVMMRDLMNQALEEHDD